MTPPTTTSHKGSAPSTHIRSALKPRTRYIVSAWLFFALSCAGYFLTPQHVLTWLSSSPPGHFTNGDVMAQTSSTSPDNTIISLRSTGEAPSLINKPKDILANHPHFDEYAFDLLTTTGAEIFKATREFIEIQKSPQFDRYAQPLMCMTNAAHVYSMTGHKFFSKAATYSIPNFLYEIEQEGGQVHILPVYTDKDKNKKILRYINKYFPLGLPTGAVVAGCTEKMCNTDMATQAHVGIIGDKDHLNQIMLYHNNWLRPSVTDGERSSYMPSLENYYDRRRPRQWQATPWIKLSGNPGQYHDIETILPELDDLDPLNHKFHIHIVIPEAMVYELAHKDYLEHHRALVSDQVVNVHRQERLNDPELTRTVCRSHKPFRTLNARIAPGGIRHVAVYEKLGAVRGTQTFLQTTFEFEILETAETQFYTWYSILVYDANRYWGSYNKGGAIWIKSEDAKCSTKLQAMNRFDLARAHKAPKQPQLTSESSPELVHKITEPHTSDE